MTDNEIIKALDVLKGWQKLAYHNDDGTDEDSHELYIVLTIIFEYINRQKAEIEQWEEEANRYQNLWCLAERDLQTVKSEARKEFAEELISKARKYTEYDEGGWDRDVYAVEVAEIDKVLKEKEKET